MGADLPGDAGRAGLNAELLRRRLREGPPLLYAILDFALVAPAQRLFVGEALCAARVDALQLRAKSESPRGMAALAAALLPIARAHDVPLLINDRVDVALAIGADGVHLGAGDLPPEAARGLLGEGPLLGCTAHDDVELEALDRAAGAAGIDYVGFGAIYPTRTKKDARERGPAALTAAVARTRLPLVAIGGIQPDRIAAIRASGMAGIAVASALSRLERVPGAVQAFRVALAS